MHTIHPITPPKTPPRQIAAHLMEVALTHIPTPIRAGLIVPDSGLLPRSVAISCWLAAKSAQRLEDDTSGSITPERMMRLDRMPHYWPEPVSLPVSEVEAGRLRATPAIRAACARRATLTARFSQPGPEGAA